LSSAGEYTIDGDAVNRLLGTYKLETHMLTGQVFETIQKKLVKSLADEIEDGKFQTVTFSNMEAIASGPHKDFLYAICGGLAELIDLLTGRGVKVIGTVRDARVLPWNLVFRIDKRFKGIAPSQ